MVIQFFIRTLNLVLLSGTVSNTKIPIKDSVWEVWMFCLWQNSSSPIQGLK